MRNRARSVTFCTQIPHISLSREGASLAFMYSREDVSTTRDGMEKMAVDCVSSVDAEEIL